MIDFVSIRNSIITGLNNHLSVPVIDGNTVNKKPNYPYVSFVITTTFSEDFENEKSLTYDGANTTRTEDGQMVISFTTHSNDYDQSRLLGLNALSYFEFYEELNANGIVVVNTTPLTDRDVLLVDTMERRVGFDTMFRVQSTLTRTDVPITDVDVNYNI